MIGKLSMPTNTPVLFITFARPEYARQTFDGIKKAKPAKLYFYSNKARVEKLDEIERNNQIREFADEIDWECDLKLFFREEYVDVYTSLWGAIDWVFENEEQAIILEEDCVPSLAFFDFCEQLLPKYKDDHRVWVISGNNFIEGFNPSGYDYFYSYFPYMYGWASWRNRWQKVIRNRLPYEEIKNYRLFDQIYIKKDAVKKALNFTKRIVNTRAWDYRFTISMKCQGSFGIIPKDNLVSNIGISGAHNKGKHGIFHNRDISEKNTYEIKVIPPFVVPDYRYSNYWYKFYYLKRKNIFLRSFNKLSKLFNQTK